MHLLLAAGVLGSFQLSLVEAFYVADLLLLSLDLLLELILLHLSYSTLRCSTSHQAFQLIQLSLYHTNKDKWVKVSSAIYYYFFFFRPFMCFELFTGMQPHQG